MQHRIEDGISVARHLRHEHAFARTAAMKGSTLQGYVPSAIPGSQAGVAIW